jgi:hypothetical protein
MMIDFENAYNAWDEHLTGGQYPVGAAATLSPEPAVEEEPMAEQQPFPEGVDLAEMALNHVRRNGMEVDRTIHETRADEERDAEMAEDGESEIDEDNAI